MRAGPIAATAAFVLAATAGPPASAQDQAKDQLRKALDDQLAGTWVYDDIQAGFAEAKRTSKPMLVVFR